DVAAAPVAGVHDDLVGGLGQGAEEAELAEAALAVVEVAAGGGLPQWTGVEVSLDLVFGVAGCRRHAALRSRFRHYTGSHRQGNPGTPHGAGHATPRHAAPQHPSRESCDPLHPAILSRVFALQKHGTDNGVEGVVRHASVRYGVPYPG